MGEMDGSPWKSKWFGLGIVWVLSAVEDTAGSSFGADHTKKEVSSDCPFGRLDGPRSSLGGAA